LHSAIDNTSYYGYEKSQAVWVTNGRGLVSRLWLDFFAVGIYSYYILYCFSLVMLYRALDFNYEDEQGVTLFPPITHDSKKRKEDEEETVYLLPNLVR
jgi:hypothetical protein